ncbi:hypothetical protein EBR43_02450 [bacterium]|jgi:hypothetical protein|nr:hypothetical protein [bacterium]NBX72062.1 hypothetical protein [bacterium]
MRAKALFGVFCLTLYSAGLVAKSTFSGEIRMDASLQTKITNQTNTPSLFQAAGSDTLALTRIRVDYTNRPSRSLGAFIRLQSPEIEDVQILGLDRLVDSPQPSLTLSQAYGTFYSSGGQFHAGYIAAPDVTMELIDYQVGFGQRVGNIIGRLGNHLGVSLTGNTGQMGFSVGIWDQTPNRNITSINPVNEIMTPTALEGAVAPNTNLNTNEIAQSLPSSCFDSLRYRYGYGGRLAYVPYYKAGHAFGLGFGYSYAPLNTPVMLGVLYHPYQAGVAAASPSPAMPAQGDYRLTAFSMLTNLKLDATLTNGNVQMGLGFSSQYIKNEHMATVLTSDTTGGSPVATDSSHYIFEDYARARGYYAEVAMLIIGQRYKFDLQKSMVSGVKLAKGKPGLEVALRAGVSDFTNLFALIDPIGSNDFLSSSYPSSGMSGEDRLKTEAFLKSESNQNYLAITVDNSGSDYYVIPEKVTGYSFFGLGGAKDIMNSFRSNQVGFVFDINYYFNENMLLKFEFQQVNCKKQIFGQDSSMVNSINFKKLSYFRMRFDVNY